MDCGHFRDWHGPYGCERMNSGWCKCDKIYEASEKKGEE
jgi:hypothetical protein